MKYTFTKQSTIYFIQDVLTGKILSLPLSKIALMYKYFTCFGMPVQLLVVFTKVNVSVENTRTSSIM